jgi:hypothetical protein
LLLAFVFGWHDSLWRWSEKKREEEHSKEKKNPRATREKLKPRYAHLKIF